MTHGLHHDSSSNGAVPTTERGAGVRQAAQGAVSSDTDDPQRAVRRRSEQADGSSRTARFDKPKYFPGSQEDVARSLAHGPVNAAQAVGADTLARVHRGTRLARFRSNRTVGRAMAVGKRLDRHVRAGRSPAAWGGPVDPLFATLLLYLLRSVSPGRRWSSAGRERACKCGRTPSVATSPRRSSPHPSGSSS